MELKTITSDCDGSITEEFKPLKECFDNNIESTSAMGMFYSLAICAHSTAVGKEMLSGIKKK